MENITLTGIDLSKSVFEVRSENHTGRLVRRGKMSREKLLKYVQQLPRGSTVVMEACGSAHFWARTFAGMGLKPKLIAPQFVSPFRKSQKNDRNDAEAICEAARRPGMRFVGIKNEEQLDMQALHRALERLITNRTALVNQLRNFLFERGVTIPLGVSQFKERMVDVLMQFGEHANFGFIIKQLWEEFCSCDARIQLFDKQIKSAARANEDCRKILKIAGVGEKGATALVAFIGKPESFKNGRCLAAALGLVPRQFSTGGKTVLGGITKAGDGYIRKLLVHGARSVVRFALQKEKTDAESLWIRKLHERRGANRTAVALANRIARHAWAILAGKSPIEAALPLAALPGEASMSAA